MLLSGDGRGVVAGRASPAREAAAGGQGVRVVGAERRCSASKDVVGLLESVVQSAEDAEDDGAVVGGAQGGGVVRSEDRGSSGEGVFDQLECFAIAAHLVIRMGEFRAGGQGLRVVGSELVPPLLVEVFGEA